MRIGGRFAWLRQLCGLGSYLGACLDLFHAGLARYRCYKRKSVGGHPGHMQIGVLLLGLACMHTRYFRGAQNFRYV